VSAEAQNVSTVAGGGTTHPANNICIPAGFAGIYQGNYYIRSCQQVYKVTPGGQWTLIAGTGTLPGFSGDGGPATSAVFGAITDVFVDGSGNVFISDSGNQRVREVSAATGIINTVAGNGNPGFGGDGGSATSAELFNPQGIFVDGLGNIFIADLSNQRIRKVTAGVISTVAGNGTLGFSGDSGPPTTAELFNPTGVAVDGSGNIFIADTGNSRVREVSGGVINTVAGTGVAAFSGDGGPAISARLASPQRVFVDSSGNLYISDATERIREVVGGIINTVAGNGIFGFTGDGGAATSAEIASPLSISVDGSGNIFFSNLSGIREVLHASGNIITVIGNSAFGYSGDNGPAASAQLFAPEGVAVDSFGNVFFADAGNYRIREVVASTGIIQTVAGNGTAGFSGDGGPATSAQIQPGEGLAVDSSGNIFFVDRPAAGLITSCRIREVVASTGNIRTVAGNGNCVNSGDGGPATSAGLGLPDGLSVDQSGRIFITQVSSPRVRMVTAVGGTITTVAGNGTIGFSGDSGPATSAALNNPTGVYANGVLFIADDGNARVRETFVGGTISTIAGNGISGYTGDGGPATSAEIVPLGISGDNFGDIFISGGNVIRGVTSGIIQTVAGVGYPGFAGDGGPATSAVFDNPTFMAVNSAGDLIITDTNNARIRMVGVNPAPAISSISPISTASGTGFTLTVMGTSFVSGAAVFFDGSPLATTFVSATQLTATVTSSNVSTAGFHDVLVVNPGPGGGYSNDVTFTVYTSNPVPAITDLYPSVVAAGGSSFTLTVTGTNFAAGAVVNFNGAARATTVVNEFEVLATITAPDISTAGAYSVTVTNPAPGGGTSNASTFSVNPGGATPFLFVPVPPCRIADTRNPNGSFGGPSLPSGGTRSFPIPSSSCGIPSTAAAYSLNVTVVPGGALGYISMWPTGQAQPLVSTLNSLDGRVKANAAIVPAGKGAVSVFASDATNVILDINGYFVPTTVSSALAFYPVTPCRVADTRSAAGALGGPSLVGGQVRSFPVLSACGIPSTAQAYSLNFTAIPQGPLGYLSVWPAGQAQPLVSTLNAPTGTITANAAIVPAGMGGAIDLFVTDTADMVIDINGYFAPPGPGGLSLYTLAPCRALDSRQNGAPFSGVLNVNVTASGCGAPGSALAYVFNATVVPPGSLGFLTLWPEGAAQPLVSTLNAIDGSLTSNLAIVPAAGGAVSAFASNPTQLILDTSGYFAPVTETSAIQLGILGNWAGTATATDSFGEMDTVQVSATVTQVGNSITATVVSTSSGDVPEVFTETGQLDGLAFSLPETTDGTTVTVAGSFSTNGLGMSGNGTDIGGQNTGSGTLTVSSNGLLLTGTATDSEGDVVTWTLNKQ
jgi:sugar lactone lactonase YvrE